MTALTLITLSYSIQKHVAQGKLRRIRDQVSADRYMIFNFLEFPAFFIEFVIMLIHYPPFLDMVEVFETNVETLFPLLATFQILKLFYLSELIRHYSALNTSKGRFVGSLSKIPISNSFLIKTWIKMNPVMALLCGTIFYLVVTTYLLYLTERNSSYT